MKQLRYFFLACLFLQLQTSCADGGGFGGEDREPAAGRSMDSLRQKINAIIAGKDATVGVAIIGPEGEDDSLTVNGQRHFTMMSVVKFPQALAILHRVDKRQLSLKDSLLFEKSDLRETYSPLRDKRPEGNYYLPLPEVLQYAVGTSDNNACDRLFKVSPMGEVESYFHQMNYKEIGIRTDYAHMKENTPAANWSSPWCMAQLTEAFYQRRLLQDSTQKLLWKIMTESANPSDRIKGGVPQGTVVAHKTGTMAEDSFAVAFNDVGMVELPGGRHFTIVVFINDSRESQETNAAIIAEITKMTWEFFTVK